MENTPLRLIIFDVKTMNYVCMDNLAIEENRLVNLELNNLAKFVNFKRIFDSLYLESDHNEEQLMSKPFFFLMLYQSPGNDGERFIALYQKFLYQGYNQQLSQQLIDLLMTFFMRFLLTFDPSKEVSFE